LTKIHLSHNKFSWSWYYILYCI